MYLEKYKVTALFLGYYFPFSLELENYESLIVKPTLCMLGYQIKKKERKKIQYTNIRNTMKNPVPSHHNGKKVLLKINSAA